VSGYLRCADDIKNNITVIDDENKKHTIFVPDGMKDIVKLLWAERVSIIGKTKNKKVTMVKIDQSLDV
jgi:hypothetical protein